ncbi:predicted protein [Histoplasma capsulatum H143]|uniref:Uncharacterized protein n=1 Tax=Ajellomyces capsulatus (strain H143) TaxID=544712 RepID=C6HLW2_AJECH|nr:predicted protein [Histoplasma capsulatum H143]
MKRGEAHNVHDFATSTKKRARSERNKISQPSAHSLNQEAGMCPFQFADERQNKQKFLVLMRLGASQPETPLSHHHRRISTTGIGRGLTLSTSTVEEFAKVSRGEQPSK